MGLRCAMTIWDVAVVGAGPVGAAAARHLAAAGATVLVIGAPEPADPTHAEVFASHHDRARVQRLLGFDELWTRLSVETAAAWPELERRTGRTVHDPVGCLYLAPGPDDYLRGATALAVKFGLTHQKVDGAAEARRFAPQLQVPPTVVGLFESGPAGSLDPRQVIAAQLQVAAGAGAQVVRDVVVGVQRSGGVSTLTTAAGQVHRAATVLTATGSFTNASRLLPRPLDVRIKGETVLLAEVSAATAEELSTLPSVLYEVETDELDGIYLIKPLQYPDGRWYLKLGMNQAVDPDLSDPTALRSWFRDTTADDTTLPRLRTELLALFPQVPFLSFRTKRCVLSRTVGRRPYLGRVDDGLVVAMGCNGYSAMASDAQGRIAAALVTTGGVPAGYDADNLQVRFT